MSHIIKGLCSYTITKKLRHILINHHIIDLIYYRLGIGVRQYLARSQPDIHILYSWLTLVPYPSLYPSSLPFSTKNNTNRLRARCMRRLGFYLFLYLLPLSSFLIPFLLLMPKISLFLSFFSYLAGLRQKNRGAFGTYVFGCWVLQQALKVHNFTFLPPKPDDFQSASKRKCTNKTLSRHTIAKVLKSSSKCPQPCSFSIFLENDIFNQNLSSVHQSTAHLLAN